MARVSIGTYDPTGFANDVIAVDVTVEANGMNPFLHLYLHLDTNIPPLYRRVLKVYLPRGTTFFSELVPCPPQAGIYFLHADLYEGTQAKLVATAGQGPGQAHPVEIH